MTSPNSTSHATQGQRDGADHKLHTVLIAEDEHLLAQSMANNLVELGYRVMGPVSSGASAMELARQKSPDIALLDVRMPEMDGLETARRLYEELFVPSIIVSAYSNSEYVDHGIDSGVLGYMLKPVTIDELRVSLAVAWGQHLKHRQMAQTLADMQRRLEERKVIERAKGILIKQLSIDEETAMRTLQRQARDARRPMAELARAIIDADAIMQGANPGKSPATPGA